MLIVCAQYCPQMVLIRYSLSLHFKRPGKATEAYQTVLTTCCMLFALQLDIMRNRM